MSQENDSRNPKARQELAIKNGGEVPSVVPTIQTAILVPPELVGVVEAWEHLPNAIRLGILALVRAAGGDDA